MKINYTILMFWILNLLLIFALIAIPILAKGSNTFEIAVQKSVIQQMKSYPESTLKDLYKSFFQDRFGPYHIINDTSAARNYLIRELDSYSIITGEMIEPTGWQHNFYRVNLRVIKENLISLEILLNALVRSANENESETITIEEWRKEWGQIEVIIRAMNLSIPDYEITCQEINDKLREGNYVGHHSKAYNEAYEPHYRIISKQIFEEEIFPLLEKQVEIK